MPKIAEQYGGGLEDIDKAEPGGSMGREEQVAKARREAYLRRLMKLYNISRDDAETLAADMGGINEVIKKFSMVEEDDLKKNTMEGRTMVSDMKARKSMMKQLENE